MRLTIRDRRRLGAGLLAFGSSGLVILLAVAAFVVASLGSLGPFGGDLQTQVRALSRSLDATSSALGATRTATGNLGASVASAATSARGAASLATQLATTMHDLSGAMNISFLGTRPFAPLGGEFDQVGARSTDLANEMTTLATSLDANGRDASSLAGQVADLQAAVEGLRATVGPGSDLGSAAALVSIARALLLALAVWLAIPAIAALWLGARIYRSARLPSAAGDTRGRRNRGDDELALGQRREDASGAGGDVGATSG